MTAQRGRQAQELRNIATFISNMRAPHHLRSLDIHHYGTWDPSRTAPTPLAFAHDTGRASGMKRGSGAELWQGAAET